MSNNTPIESFLEEQGFVLQILHTSDQEAGIPALEDAIGLSAVMNALEPQYENTIKLSSGDLFIAGPFLNASLDIYDSVTDAEPAGKAGIADILIQNELGWNAAAVGNHEFDAGPGTFFELLAPNPDIVNGVNGGKGIGVGGYPGALFPYLATNLDYAEEANLQSLVVPNGEKAKPNSLAGSVIVDVNGEEVGVVGAVVPYLPQIANIGGIKMLTDNNAATIEAYAQTLAENIQPVVDELVAQGINKVILMTHLQQFEIEQALAPLLSNVDVLMGGGSHRVMANDDDILRQDETQIPPQLLQPYPQEFQDADGNTIYLINTNSNYRYLSRLAIEFDANGNGINVLDDSGTFATDLAGVDRLYEEDITEFDQVKAKADPELVEIVEGVGNFINTLDSEIYGNSQVYLNGLREAVRTEETNLGNLTADANRWYAEQYGLEIDISVKNGGGIRDQIGVSFIAGGGDELVQLPPQANPEVGKEDGDISRLDIANSLRFDNDISVVEISAAGIKDLAEHFVAQWAPGVTAGQFGQIGNFVFSYDPDGTPIEFERDANSQAIGVVTPGDRIQNIAILRDDGTKEIIVQNGELQVDAGQIYTMVILSFLADGGDGYPVFHFQNPITLSELDPVNIPDQAVGLVQGGEQDALAEYLAAFHGDAPVAYAEADTPIEEDERIQNLNFREDTIIDEGESSLPEVVFGTVEDDLFDAAFPDEKQFVGAAQILFTGSGNDTVDVSQVGSDNRLDTGSGDDVIFAGTNNRILAGMGDDLIFAAGGDNVITGGMGADQFWLILDTGDLPAMVNIITDFEVENDVIGFANSGLSFADLGNDWNYTQEGASVLVTAFGQEIGLLLNTQVSDLTEANFVIA
ncbi:MAG: 5'-nucleotidase C-terminal domain-containing protein [Gomphosphaeria aponina SAG 52.96 = DSM 107014]|uniref:5'-nucleotidase C-terminal domain-containing protein n=1 Tax=Gomphosphaeria aponina SAG 52.96 = DSM 107014 TaxID=1521640 RepID=A0A941GU50_9CHRO|nr:5'-nucleotidase C-terminal domain-containing protein [Gomphosphaeria aponina SAG 52.96 = DSM 107014]